MNKIKTGNIEKPRERINQFIVECIFNKYFEEKAVDSRFCGNDKGKVLVQAETKVAV
jgi:hypothetical protein